MSKFSILLMSKTIARRYYKICKTCKHFHLNRFGFVCKEERGVWISESEFNKTIVPDGCPMMLELLVLNCEVDNYGRI